HLYRPARPAGEPDSSGSSALSAALSAAPRPGTTRDPETAPAGAALAVSGNKTLAGGFGAGPDAAPSEAVDPPLGWVRAAGGGLAGAVSVGDTRLSAAGSTQDIQSLDRVLVELKARDGAGSLGDIPLAVARGEFARLERRVQGVSGEWRPGSLVVRAAAAGAQ